MNARTLKALRASIAHWRRMTVGRPREYETIGPDDCALCKLFHEKFGCMGCPVREHTGEKNCRSTPYVRAEYIFDLHGLSSYLFRKAAQDELDFLKSLLPKRRKVKD